MGGIATGGAREGGQRGGGQHYAGCQDNPHNPCNWAPAGSGSQTNQSTLTMIESSDGLEFFPLIFDYMCSRYDHQGCCSDASCRRQ